MDRFSRSAPWGYATAVLLTGALALAVAACSLPYWHRDAAADVGIWYTQYVGPGSGGTSGLCPNLPHGAGLRLSLHLTTCDHETAAAACRCSGFERSAGRVLRHAAVRDLEPDLELGFGGASACRACAGSVPRSMQWPPMTPREGVPVDLLAPQPSPSIVRPCSLRHGNQRTQPSPLSCGPSPRLSTSPGTRHFVWFVSPHMGP